MASYRDLVQRFGRLHVLVVGDVCLDRYITGRPTRLSREAPVPVLEWQREYALPGAASNPALNIVALGAGASLVSLAGADEAGGELRRLLAEGGVDAQCMLVSEAHRTTEKTRVLAEGLLVVPQQVARIDRTDHSPVTPEQEALLCAHIAELAPTVDAILISDYRGSVISDAVIGAVREAASRYGRLTTVDSQGELYRFGSFDSVRCNQAEARSAFGVCLATEQDFEREMPGMLERVGSRRLVITREGDGISAYSREEGYHHVEGLHVRVADVVGAGDTVIAVLTLALAADEPLPVAAHVANQAAALVVQQVGNACPTPAELLHALETHGR